MKSRLAILLCSLYGIAAVGFTIYFANNFSKYDFTYKGDEIFFFAEILVSTTYLFYIIFQIAIKKINFFLFLFLPLATCITAVLIGLIVMLMINLNGTPREIILTYGFVYTVLTLYVAYVLGIFRRVSPIKKIL